MNADQVLVVRLDRGFKPGYYSAGEESMCKGKILELINLRCVVDFSSDKLLAQLSCQLCINQIQRCPSPPPRATAGHLLTLSVPGAGH